MSPRLAIAVWAAALALCLAVISQTRFHSDMAAFLPGSASPAQRLMAQQLQEGVASRLILLAVEGGSAGERAETSRRFARALAASGRFNYVRNGETALTPEEWARLREYRYLLSPRVEPGHFDVPQLSRSLEESLRLLASPLGPMVRGLLPADPTGELLALLEARRGRGPALHDGVWSSRDGKRALLVAETRAAPFDLDAQGRTAEVMEQAFSASRAAPGLTLAASGSSRFALESRRLIEGDAWRLSLVATALVSLILLSAYGSPRLLALGLLPVASGGIAGLAAVSLVHGSVHGITLGFGATLIGEAVDYPTYLFTQRAAGETPGRTLERILPTLRLAVLTTVVGSLAMLLSGFPGLSQLGLFTLVGVLTAGLATRHLLPAVAPARLPLADRARFQSLLATSAAVLAHLKWLPPAALLAAGGYLAMLGQAIWENDPASLSPVPERAKLLDTALRAELGAPDVRYLIAVPAPSQETALQRSEALLPELDRLVARGALSGYDLTARLAPSRRTQAARQAALPDPALLKENLRQAAASTPFRAEVFQPFLQDVERSRHLPPLEPGDWSGTPLGSLVGGLLVEEGKDWAALVSLGGVTDEAALRAVLGETAEQGAFLLDIKGESGRMLARYRDRSLLYVLLGLAAILAVLAWGLPDGRAVAAALLPVCAAMVATAALLVLGGARLSLFHVVALLLVLGIGLNYGLFFRRPARDEEERRRVLFSVLVCAASAVSGFGVLVLSSTPVLHAIGATVALGAALSLLFAAMWSAPAGHGKI